MTTTNKELEKAKQLLKLADIAIANYKAEIEVWMEDLHKTEAIIVQLKNELVDPITGNCDLCVAVNCYGYHLNTCPLYEKEPG
jgi:hypothetical protein